MHFCYLITLVCLLFAELGMSYTDILVDKLRQGISTRVMWYLQFFVDLPMRHGSFHDGMSNQLNAQVAFIFIVVVIRLLRRNSVGSIVMI